MTNTALPHSTVLSTEITYMTDALWWLTEKLEEESKPEIIKRYSTELATCYGKVADVAPDAAFSYLTWQLGKIATFTTFRTTQPGIQKKNVATIGFLWRCVNMACHPTILPLVHSKEKTQRTVVTALLLLAKVESTFQTPEGGPHVAGKFAQELARFAPNLKPRLGEKLSSDTSYVQQVMAQLFNPAALTFYLEEIEKCAFVALASTLEPVWSVLRENLFHSEKNTTQQLGEQVTTETNPADAVLATMVLGLE